MTHSHWRLHCSSALGQVDGWKCAAQGLRTQFDRKGTNEHLELFNAMLGWASDATDELQAEMRVEMDRGNVLE